MFSEQDLVRASTVQGMRDIIEALLDSRPVSRVVDDITCEYTVADDKVITVRFTSKRNRYINWIEYDGKRVVLDNAE